MNNFDYKKFFEGKKITKQGFGTLGRGFGVVKFLLECGAEVLVTDIKEEATFTKQIEELKNYPNVKYFLGGHREDDFINCDFVIAGSGVPKDNIYLSLSKKNNIPVYQESSLFAKIVKDNLPNTKIIGITGTRGKTTTTFLVYELLKAKFGIDKVHLGGNVQGISTLENLKKVKDGDFIVMELDSWVLQGFGDLKISPDISIFTTFMPDHMNYYKNDMQEYFLDKANIFIYQKKGNSFITTKKMSEDIVKYLGEDYRAKYNLENSEFFVDEDKKYDTKLLGSHNQVLIALVEKLSEILEIEERVSQEVVANFAGVPGRLQFIKEVGGIKIYNDTCATTPDAVIAGTNAVLENLSEDSKVVLICGGRDKELGLERLVKEFSDLQDDNKLELIFLNDDTTTGTKKLLEEIEKQNSQIRYASAKTLANAVEIARTVGNAGDTILFSPGFASFGMFQNEYDRGDQFNELIKRL